MSNKFFRRPLVYVSVLFGLGIIIANTVRIPFFIIYFISVICLIFGIFFIKRNPGGFICLSFLVFFSGMVSLVGSRALPKCHISRMNIDKNSEYVVKGFIDSEPEVKNNKSSFIFRLEGIQLNHKCRSCCGNALVYAPQDTSLRYGQGLVLKASLYRPRRKYLYTQGIYAVMRISSKSAITRLNNHKGHPLKRFALCLKERLEEVIYKYVSDIPASILDAMVLGDKKNIPPVLYNLMVKTGTVHILVVSGFNVGIVASTILLFLKLICLPYKVRIYIAIPLLILYCFITGASNPVLRATIMAMVFLCSYLFKRQSDIYNSSSLAALCILIFKPQNLFDIGFQLSFASVLSIAYLYPRINSFLRLDSLRPGCLRLVLEGCIVSLSAWLGILWLILYYFKLFSPITVLANIFIVPLATLITLCGFSLVLASLTLPGLTPYIASTSELIVGILLQITAFLVKLPFACFYLA